MSGRRLYIGRLPQDVTRKDLDGFFGAIGPIVDIRIMAGFCFLEFEELKDAETAVADYSGKDFMGERLIVEFAKPPRNLDPERRTYGGDRGGYGGDRGGYGGDRGGYGDRRGGYGDRGGDRGGYDDRRGGGGYGAPRGGGYESRGPPRGGGGHRLVVNGVPDGVSWQDLKDFARSAGTVTFADVDRHTAGVGYIEYPSRSDADEAIRTLSNTDLKGANVTVEDAPAGSGGGGDRGGGGGGGGGRRDDGYSSRRDEGGYRSRRDDDWRRDDRDRRRSNSPPRRRDRSPIPERKDDRERERSPVRERDSKDW